MTQSNISASSGRRIPLRGATSLFLCSTLRQASLCRTRKSPTRSSRNARPAFWMINKWDLIAAPLEKGRRDLRQNRGEKHREGQAKPLTSLAEFGDWVREKLFFLDYAPVIFTSATSGLHLDRLLESVRYVASQLRQKIPTVDPQPHAARRHRTPPAREFCRASAEVFLRDANQAIPADISAIR